MDIAVIGSTMTDLVTRTPRMPAVGETLTGTSFTRGHGGKGANQAVAAARLGSQVLLLTRIGDDAFADDALANFTAQGIDTRHVLRTPGTSSGLAPIMVDDHGHNAIVIIPGANDHLSCDDVEAIRNELAHCRLLVLQLEIPLPTVLHAITTARELGVPVLLNPAPAHPHLDITTLAGIDWFVPNETELALITGHPLDSLDDIRHAATHLQATGITNVLVTLGERGVLWAGPQGCQHIDAPHVTPLDTTGAGDAFIGAFAHAITHNPTQPTDIPAALAAACAYAADTVTRPGTQNSYPTAEQFTAGQFTS